MRKPALCICENKDADQLRGNREADQRLCFRNIDTVRLPVPGHFYSCVVSKYLLRENENFFFTIIKHYHSPK